jgi:hypothetical protein
MDSVRVKYRVGDTSQTRKGKKQGKQADAVAVGTMELGIGQEKDVTGAKTQLARIQLRPNHLTPSREQLC